MWKLKTISYITLFNFKIKTFTEIITMFLYFCSLSYMTKNLYWNIIICSNYNIRKEKSASGCILFISCQYIHLHLFVILCDVKNHTNHSFFLFWIKHVRDILSNLIPVVVFSSPCILRHSGSQFSVRHLIYM